MTPEEHNKYISWTFLANGLFQGSILLLVFGFLIAMFVAVPPEDGFPAFLFAGMFSVILLINLALISPNFIAYYGLKNRKSWARIASIVAAVLGAMNVPIGTAACVYSLWFFFGEDWKALYPEAPGARDRRQIASTSLPNWDGRYVREDGEVVYRPATPPDWR
jgi:hypothetical protein